MAWQHFDARQFLFELNNFYLSHTIMRKGCEMLKNNFDTFSDVMEYEPDADMIFNYLMVSALAAATDFVEKEGLKPTGGEQAFLKIHILSL